MRSAHLERDFHDRQALSGYVLTDHSREALTRIACALRPSSGQRAWRITGDFGAGKTSFALLLAHWFAGHNRTFPAALRSQIAYKSITGKIPHALPVLVTGSREPIAQAIARGMIDACGPLYSSGRCPTFLTQLKAIADQELDPRLRDEEVIQALAAASERIIADRKGSGLLLIIDELGKFLEYATLHPERQDIYLLQRLAETASRSKDTPVYVVALLHQGFHEYAHSLSEVAQREWEKVAARFEEILFNQPLEQLTALVGAALNIRCDRLPVRIKREAESAMRIAVDVGWFGAAPAHSGLVNVAASTFPLHPSVLPILARFFRRFGQNERSLFGFLLSNEAFGLRAFSERPIRGDSFYRLHHFYDYVRCNFGHRLGVRSYRSHWNQVDSIIQSYVPSDPVELEILKTVGILNLIDADDLRPTEDILLLAVAPPNARAKRSKVTRSLASLRSRKGVLHHRGRAGGFSLWPYTSVNLELAYERAVDAVPAALHVSSRIPAYAETRPVVARRHYIKTGNLRYFEVKYFPIGELPDLLPKCELKGDGLMLVPLCETESERRQAVEFACSPDATKRHNMIVAISPPLNNLAGVIAEAERWEWVARNTPELGNDRYANEEVSRQVKSAMTALERRLAAFVGLHQFSGETSLEFFHSGAALSVRSGRDLLERLSTICDNLFDQAPEIKNELVNRQALSSAAAAARMRLIERILEHPSEPLLGMSPAKRPPEMSMYLSVLQAANLHRSIGDSWRLCPPEEGDDPCGILPAWQEIETVLQRQPDARVAVSDIAAALRRPPFGVRDGVIPILLAAYVVANRDKVAVYEDGTYCPTVHGQEFMRLTKAPESFEIQYCRADGVRSEILRKVWQLVAHGGAKAGKLAILDVVRPICVFVASLPDYTRHTSKLSDKSIAVREAILSAHDPTRLLFCELPKACVCKPIIASGRGAGAKQNTNEFIMRLGAALSELRMAYPQLIDRIEQQLHGVLDLPADGARLRNAIAERATTILPSIGEPRLKALCMRLSDDGLSDAKWVESVGSFLASRPPSKWNDSDEGQFQHELAVLGTRFARVEGMLFEKGIGTGDPTGVRITLTRPDGRERDRVIYSEHAQEEAIAETEAEILKLVSAQGSAGLAAASQALWKALSDGGEDHE